MGSSLGRDRLASLAARLEQSASNSAAATGLRTGITLSFSPTTVSTQITLWAIREKSGFLRRRNPEPMQLTTGQSNMFSPVPSRDGKKLFAIQGASQGELVRYDAKSQQFVPYLSGISAIQLGFSKDGQWVAYTSFPDLNSVAKQSGRNGAASAHFSSSMVTGHAAMVARWETDRIRCLYAGQDHAHLRRVGRWRSSPKK